MPANVPDEWFRWLSGLLIGCLAWAIKRLFSRADELDKKISQHAEKNTEAHAHIWEAHHVAQKEMLTRMATKEDIKEMEARLTRLLKSKD